MNDYLDYKIKTGFDDDGGSGGGGGCSGGGCLTVIWAALFIWAVITGLINLMS